MLPLRKGQHSNLGAIRDPKLPVLGLKNLISTDIEFGFHSHCRGQLAYASSGVIKIFTDDGRWVIPASQAVWIPGEINHSINPEVTSEARHLFIDPSLLNLFPKQCSVVDVSPLLRELILRVAGFGEYYEPDSPASHICTVILDELKALKPSLLHLPSATDRRLLRVMHNMIEQPRNDVDLHYWADIVGSSERTLSRLFVKETGMNFQKWRRQLLLQKAIELLGQGESVIQVSLELGYSSPSSFVTMFRKALGKPPGTFFKEL